MPGVVVHKQALYPDKIVLRVVQATLETTSTHVYYGPVLPEDFEGLWIKFVKDTKKFFLFEVYQTWLE